MRGNLGGRDKFAEKYFIMQQNLTHLVTLSLNRHLLKIKPVLVS